MSNKIENIHKKINSTNKCFQNKNIALKIISKVEAKTWTAGTSADWQRSNSKILTAQAKPPPYLVPHISEPLNEQFTWHLHMAKFFNQFLFYMVKPKLKIKWKLVKQRAWAVTLN